MSEAPQQRSLLSEAEAQYVAVSRYQNRPQTLELSATALTQWKQRVFDFQQACQRDRPAHPSTTPVALTDASQGDLFASQGSLFDATASYLNEPPVPAPVSAPKPLALPDPFSLPRQNTEFWRWTYADAGIAAFYFVIDWELPLLLYIGETVKSNQRWKGEHDCKRYLQNYVTAHRSHHLPVTVNISFWREAPSDRRDRQRLESALIRTWRSPFNKENWARWSTPFVGGKS